MYSEDLKEKLEVITNYELEMGFETQYTIKYWNEKIESIIKLENKIEEILTDWEEAEGDIQKELYYQGQKYIHYTELEKESREVLDSMEEDISFLLEKIQEKRLNV